MQQPEMHSVAMEIHYLMDKIHGQHPCLFFIEPGVGSHLIWACCMAGGLFSGKTRCVVPVIIVIFVVFFCLFCSLLTDLQDLSDDKGLSKSKKATADLYALWPY